AWTRQGVHLGGPSPKGARRRRGRLGKVLEARPLTFDGRWAWFAGTGPTAPEHVPVAVARAAGAAGAVALARATASAPARARSGNAAEAARHLPGFLDMPDRRGRESAR